jgi:hypothetical protein
MIKLELTVDQAEALYAIVGQMNWYETAAILCKTYSEQGMDRASFSLTQVCGMLERALEQERK